MSLHTTNAPLRAVAGFHAGAKPAAAALHDRRMGEWLGDLEPLRALMAPVRMLARNQPLYRDGEEADYIYVVHSGSFKLLAGAPDGREQVCGFRMTGDMLGLDGIGTGCYATTAVAMENAGVRAVAYALLVEHFSDRELQDTFHRHLSHEIARDSELIMLLGGMSAEGRVAAFLVNHSRRLGAMGYSPTEFHLRMTRADIGNHLGLSLETVSRTFSAFQHAGLLTVDKRHIARIDLPGLRERIERR